MDSITYFFNERNANKEKSRRESVEYVKDLEPNDPCRNASLRSGSLLLSRIPNKTK